MIILCDRNWRKMSVKFAANLSAQFDIVILHIGGLSEFRQSILRLSTTEEKKRYIKLTSHAIWDVKSLCWHRTNTTQAVSQHWCFRIVLVESCLPIQVLRKAVGPNGIGQCVRSYGIDLLRYWKCGYMLGISPWDYIWRVANVNGKL